jgi:hypothetical protein
MYGSNKHELFSYYNGRLLIMQLRILKPAVCLYRNSITILAYADVIEIHTGYTHQIFTEQVTLC